MMNRESLISSYSNRRYNWMLENAITRPANSSFTVIAQGSVLETPVFSVLVTLIGYYKINNEEGLGPNSILNTIKQEFTGV